MNGNISTNTTRAAVDPIGTLSGAFCRSVFGGDNHQWLFKKAFSAKKSSRHECGTKHKIMEQFIQSEPDDAWHSGALGRGACRDHSNFQDDGTVLNYKGHDVPLGERDARDGEQGLTQYCRHKDTGADLDHCHHRLNTKDWNLCKNLLWLACSAVGDLGWDWEINGHDSNGAEWDGLYVFYPPPKKLPIYSYDSEAQGVTVHELCALHKICRNGDSLFDVDYAGQEWKCDSRGPDRVRWCIDLGDEYCENNDPY